MPKVELSQQKVGRVCPECGHDLIKKWGKYGQFIGCSDYPNCNHTEPWLEKIGVTCPEDGGEIIVRRTKKGRLFYGCENYPDCEFSSWKKPLPEPCPSCGGLLVAVNKEHARCKSCKLDYKLAQIQRETEES
jgi:DNA topoisomerase-1